MPNKTFDFSIALEAYQQLLPELQQAGHTDPTPGLPRLKDVLAEAGPLPEDALIFGVAGDGMPLLLNLDDPTPGPILLLGDSRSGKTRFLETLARSAGLLHPPDAVSFGILTNTPEEWDPENLPENCIGIYGLYQRESRDFMLQLTSWAERTHCGRHIILLLIDDLEPLTRSGSETLRDLRFLLHDGPRCGIWPIATLEAVKAVDLEAWTARFRTHLFGSIRKTALAETLTGRDNPRLDRLVPGVQFALRGRRGWMRFWIPAID